MKNKNNEQFGEDGLISQIENQVRDLVLGYFNMVEGYPIYPFGIEPMYPGIMVSLLIYVGDRINKSS